MTGKEFALCSGFALALPIGQVLFKWAALKDARAAGPFVLRVLGNGPLIGAFAWYALTALLWFYILTRLPLSVAYPFTMVGSALVPLAAWLIFKEPLDWRFAAGYLLMLGGFALVMQGQARG